MFDDDVEVIDLRGERNKLMCVFLGMLVSDQAHQMYKAANDLGEMENPMAGGKAVSDDYIDIVGAMYNLEDAARAIKKLCVENEEASLANLQPIIYGFDPNIQNLRTYVDELNKTLKSGGTYGGTEDVKAETGQIKSEIENMLRVTLASAFAKALVEGRK